MPYASKSFHLISEITESPIIDLYVLFLFPLM